MQKALGLSLAAIAVVTVQLSARRAPKDAQSAPLVLTGAISLENVHGRIDHFGFDPKNRLFVSALGNNTEEVIDLSAQRVVHTISGVPAPQGVVYSPETNKLFVASTKGKLYIYDGTSFDHSTSYPRLISTEMPTTFGTTRQKSASTWAMEMMRLRQSAWWTRPRTNVWTKSSRLEHTRSLSNSKRQARIFM